MNALNCGQNPGLSASGRRAEFNSLNSDDRFILTTPWVPGAWIRSHGLEPCGVWSCELKQTVAPESAGVCGFARFVSDVVCQTPGAGVLFSSHCDQLRRTFDAVHSRFPSRTFLFNLPATWKARTAVRLFDSELERLGRFLITLGGHEPTRQDLVLLAEGCCFARDGTAEWDPDAARKTPSSREGTRSPGVRIALVGGPMRVTDRQVFEILERHGGRIVLNATEPGERNERPACLPRVQTEFECETVEQWRLRLAEDYAARCTDVYQRPNTRLYEWLGERLRQRQARGIVLWHHDCCDLWRAEVQTMRDRFGLPVLPLQADSLAGSAPRTATRIEAFLESLR